MKNSIEMNIGLNRRDGGKNSPVDVARELRKAGFIVTHSRLASGTWEGVTEETLAIECLVALPLCHAECRMALQVVVRRLAHAMNQSCIACKGLEHDRLIPEIAAFDPALWISPFPGLSRKEGAESAFGI